MLLDLHMRPLVQFNVSNNQHREWFSKFKIDRSWGKCPVRFIAPEETGLDLISMIEKLLLDFYINQEFRKVGV
jgi:hypothetical protein